MRLEILHLDPASYEPHRLHRSERTWMETNCYADLWVEVLHTLGLDPVAGLGFTLATDFEGDQWTMFKYPAADLRALFGIEVAELNVWRPLAAHVADHLGLGHMLSIDVDAWYLPDTAGVSYRAQHQKTTIMAQMLDPGARRLGYFHNAGYHELGDGDLDGVLRPGPGDDPALLPSYVEVVRLDRLRRPDAAEARAIAGVLARSHLERRPADNPMLRFRQRVEADLPFLAEEGLDSFHRYAFGTCRQCGANAELAADFLEWLGPDDPALAKAAEAFSSVSAAAKVLQFSLARLALGRRADLGEPFGEMARCWEEAVDRLLERFDV